MTDLRTAAQKALEALRAYGAHAHNCDFLILLTSDPPQRKPCSCGLVSSIKSIEAALAEQEQGRKKRKPKNSTTPLGIVCFEAYARSEVGSNRWDIAAEAVRAALAEPEPEPVARVTVSSNVPGRIDELDVLKVLPRGEHLLYTTPPALQPLTDEEIWDIAGNCLDTAAGRLQFARAAIDAARGTK